MPPRQARPEFRDWGKMAATFVDLASGKAIRIAAKESSKTRAREMHPEIENKNQQQMLAYREMKDEDLFSTQWVKVELPPQEFPDTKASGLPATNVAKASTSIAKFGATAEPCAAVALERITTHRRKISALVRQPAHTHAPRAKSSPHRSACPESAIQLAIFLSSHRMALKFPGCRQDRQSLYRCRPNTSPADHSTSPPDGMPPSGLVGVTIASTFLNASSKSRVKQRPHFLRFQIVGIVISRTQRISPKHDSPLHFGSESFIAAASIHFRKRPHRRSPGSRSARHRSAPGSTRPPQSQ